MNINILLYDTAYKELLSMFLDEGKSVSDLEAYLDYKGRKPESLNDVYAEFVRTATRNNWQASKVININSNEDKIRNILENYDYKYLSDLEPEKCDRLFGQFIDLFKATREIEDSIRRWFYVVLGSAVFISSRFNTIDDFNGFVNSYIDPKRVPITISKEIEGVGFKSACDVLNNLGYHEFVRPNYHLNNICSELAITKKSDDRAAFDAMRRIAADNGITPYKLDKVFQLVCSGGFFENKKRVIAKMQENRIIEIVRSGEIVIEEPLMIDAENSGQSNTVSRLIESFDKIDLTETAPEELNSKLEAGLEEADIAEIKQLCQSNRNDLLIKLLRPFTAENSNTELVEAEGYIYHVETLDDERIKVTFKSTNANMHKFNLLYLYSNFKKSTEGDYYVPLSFKEKAQHGNYLIDDLYYPFEYYYECIFSKQEAINRKWLSGTKETKYYKLEIQDLSSSDEKLNEKSDGTGRIIFYDEENTRPGKYKEVKEINKPESYENIEIKTENSAEEYFDALFKFYKKSEITIYRVGQGNCITALISYERRTKKPRFLVFDAGSKLGKSYIDATADLLKNSIKATNPKEVYFMLSHYHYDHYNIMTSLFNIMKTNGTNQNSNMFCILPCLGSHEFLNPVKLYELAIFRERARIVDGGSGKKLYENNGIKVYQGRACVSKGWKDENAQSITIQMKNTLLPADSYYRFWPNKFGQEKINGTIQYRKFKYVVAPHHGFDGYTFTEDKDRFKAIFDLVGTNSTLYINRDNNDYTNSDIDKRLKELGLSKGISDKTRVKFTYTPDKDPNPITFTDS